MPKLFQNKSLLKSIQVFLVCLVVSGGIGGAKNVAAADKNILVYYTGYYGSRANFPDIKNLAGFTTEIVIRNGSGELTDGTINLSEYSQIWIIDACAGNLFTADEISAIETFRNNCGGLLLSVDDSSSCQQRVNPIAVKFNGGVENIFYGNQATGGDCVSPSFTSHPLYSGVSKLSSSDSDACFNIQNPNIEIIARDKDLDNSCDGDSDDDIYGAVLDEAGKGRIIFDSSIYRFIDIGGCDETQYQQNIAEWLEVCPAATPPSPPPSPPPPTECKPGLVPCGRIYYSDNVWLH